MGIGAAQWPGPLGNYHRRPVLPRSRHLPVAVTEGSLTENPNKIRVRFWTDCYGHTGGNPGFLDARLVS